MTEETIALRESGLVLKYDKSCGEYTLRLCDDVSLNIAHVDAENHWGWHAWVSTHDDSGKKGSRDECVAWLDAQALELRSALLPHGAFVVYGATDMIEVAAQALMTHDAYNPKTLAELDASTNRHLRAAAAIYRDRASVVIEALRDVRHG